MLLLRYIKGIVPLKRNEHISMPGHPGPEGLIYRLDGIEHKTRTVTFQRTISIKGNGELTLPRRWKNAPLTTGRMAATAFIWAHARLAEEDEESARQYRSTMFRSIMAPLFTAFVCVALVIAKGLDWRIALTITTGVWALLAFMALPGQYRNWKAKDMAREALKERELWPVDKQAAQAIETCLSAMIWCHMAGFRTVPPR